MPFERRYLCDVLRLAYDTADWGRVRSLYEQFQQIRRSREVPTDLRGVLAECLVDLSVTYGGREELMVEHALAVFAEVDGHERFDAALVGSYCRERTDSTPRMPPLAQSVVETSRRQRDARRIEQALAGTATSGIVCGSVSYGPFYNVRGPHGDLPASDLDLIIVIEDAGQLPVIADRLAGLHGVDQPAVDRLRTRAAVFTERYDDTATILSQKVSLWADGADALLAGTGLRGDYQVSLHFLTRSTLGYVLVESSTTLTRAAACGMRTVRDYRETLTHRLDLPRTFGGREYSVRPRLESAEMGWLRWMTAYLFTETDCYCPGLLQNMLLPVSDLRWDALGVRAGLATFARKFYDRYRLELSHNPHALLRPSFTLVRGSVLAPHVIRRFDVGI